MTTEIFVEGKRLDINAAISSLLTFAIDDIKNFATRQTTFSKTIVLPGTNNNNAIFGNIFEIGQANDYNPLGPNILYNFNAAKSASCLMFQDNLQTFKGAIRILEIDIDKKRIEYQVALNGELTSLNVALSAAKLQDLDFSAYDTTYGTGPIVSSWSAAPGSGVYYPMIDYGTYSVGKHDWDIRTFRPALYVKEYIDKMFAAANFRYDCALFNTARFKKLIVPHNQKILTTISSVLLNATRGFGVPQTVISAGIGNTARFSFTNFTSVVFTPDASPATTATYTSPGPTSVLLVWDLALEFSSTASITFSVIRNSTIVVYTQVIPSTGGVTSFQFLTETAGIPVTISSGDTIEFWLTASGGVYNVKFNGGGYSVQTPSPQSVPAIVGGTLIINDSIPKNIRQVDFLMGIIKLFNLYVYEDKFDERLIYITPFVDFYSSSSGNSIDWTHKLNRDQVTKVKPMSELTSKIYNFNYKDDGDYWNDLYKKRYNIGYGSYAFDTEFEFAAETNKLELIFAGTALVGYAGEDKIYSTIYKRSGTTEDNTDSVIRILQTKRIAGVSSWSIKAGPGDTGTNLTTITEYGYAGHLDDPDAPSNDLNFGVLSELFFRLVTGDLTKTQFNIYWSAYMAEITDKDSKLVTAKFYLTPKDILDLDFSKYIYVDGVLFRLNKIIDYNTTIPSDCTVELLKVINTEYTF
jgi:hypothetical protein